MPAKIDYTGAIKRMNNGELATVIHYENSKNMTIQFEDGTIVTGVRKLHFDDGKVLNPNSFKNKHLGEVNIMSNGQKAKIISIIDSQDITIQFETGEIVEHRRYTHFLDGAISNPNQHKYQSRVDAAANKYLGMENIMNCGLVAKIVNYSDSSNVDILFEDGSLVKNRAIGDFLKGEVVSPLLPKYFANRTTIIGQINQMTNGQLCEVIAEDEKDRSYIDVKFEDGTIVKHRTRLSFRNGNIANPNYDKFSVYGQTIIQNCGMSCTCIAHRSTKDIDIQFEDGTIRKNRTKAEFLNGTIQNPNLPVTEPLIQTYIYYNLKKYFSDTLLNYRPDWLKNWRTGYNLELDIYIPSIKLGIEYDGYVTRHQQFDLNTYIKHSLIENSNQIDRFISFAERTVFLYQETNKERNIQLQYISKKQEYPMLLDEVSVWITKLLNHYGIVANISPKYVDLQYSEFNYNRFHTNLMNKLQELQK